MQISRISIIKSATINYGNTNLIMDKRKIILIEDDIFIHRLYKDALVNAGYIVVSAEDGEEGLNQIKSNTDARLILLDLMIPKLNGIEVLKELKKDPATKNLSVIVLSNVNENAVIQDALKLGANAYLIKADYIPQQIIDTVKQYIDLRSYLKS